MRNDRGLVMATLPQLRRENLKDRRDVVRQLIKAQNNKLVFPIAKLPERYLRGHLEILLEVSHLSGRGMAALIADIGINEVHRDLQGTDGIEEDQFSVLVNNVHLMQDEQQIITRVGGVVRLDVFDHLKCRGALDSLTFL